MSTSVVTDESVHWLGHACVPVLLGGGCRWSCARRGGRSFPFWCFALLACDGRFFARLVVDLCVVESRPVRLRFVGLTHTLPLLCFTACIRTVHCTTVARMATHDRVQNLLLLTSTTARQLTERAYAARRGISIYACIGSIRD